MKKMKHNFFIIFAFLFISIGFASCPAQWHYMNGIAKITIADENGSPFKKENAARFEVFNLGGFFNDQKLIAENEPNLVYKVFLAKVKIKSHSRGKLGDPEKNTIIQNLMDENGILIVDRNNEYEPTISTLKNVTYKEINDDMLEVECTIILKKK